MCLPRSGAALFGEQRLIPVGAPAVCVSKVALLTRHVSKATLLTSGALRALGLVDRRAVGPRSACGAAGAQEQRQEYPDEGDAPG
jgi:hypothetical protein